jgi:hypothetical protein
MFELSDELTTMAILGSTRLACWFGGLAETIGLRL